MCFIGHLDKSSVWMKIIQTVDDTSLSRLRAESATQLFRSAEVTVAGSGPSAPMVFPVIHHIVGSR